MSLCLVITGISVAQVTGKNIGCIVMVGREPDR
jgi:hypothetical protein